MDFKRLREKWYSLCRDRFAPRIFNKIVHPLNTKLAALSLERGYAIHGLWTVVGRGRFNMTIFEQKGELVSSQAEFELRQIRSMVSASYVAAKEVFKFTSGRHACVKNITATIAEIR